MKKSDLTIQVEDYKLNIRSSGIIIHNGKVLVHRNVNSDHYALVGGRVEIGEDSETTLKREIKEEMGKDIEIIGYISTIENFFEMKGSKYHEIMFVHRIEFIDEEDKKIEDTIKNIEGKDYLQYEWLELDEIEEYPIVPKEIKPILKEGKFPVHKINNDLDNNEKANEEIEKLVKVCDLGSIIERPIRISGGLLNRMYKIKTEKGTFAIKLLNSEVMKRPDAKDNHILAEKISNIANKNKVSCIPAKKLEGSSLQKIDGDYFLIFDWFSGKAVTDEELTIDKVKKVAIELAKIHKIDFEKIKSECKAYYDTKEVDWQFYIDNTKNEQIKELLKENLERFKILDKEAIESLNLISNNMVISHRDLDLPNVLWNDKEEPVIIDWESSGLVNPVMEVIDTAWNWSGGQNKFDKEKFISFINTYKEYGGNLNNFEEALKADYKAKFGWLEYNLKRVCGIECIDDEERKLGEIEVIRTIDEINKFEFYSIYMK